MDFKEHLKFSEMRLLNIDLFAAIKESWDMAVTKPPGDQIVIHSPHFFLLTGKN